MATFIQRMKSSQTITFNERSSETPIIVMRERNQVEVIGPPDPDSNLRPIIRKRQFNETPLQTKLREMQNDTQNWNQHFWSNHNRKFVKEKQDFIDDLINKDKDKQITADEMSGFYKKFLNDNWKTHVRYNKEWYIRNLTILMYSLGVTLEKNTLSFLTKFK
ncbi:COA8 family protein CG14806, mitochondrial isoform X2 [Diorhabda carinulata]|uniref:COA8 family protein CG14806, mitochondrial isoform X2 n=1 Tax=Diorhabda carinulata TaxID=1163345 RepID=UPI0025A269F2|nr:COA8 family protein CG14806, mitochondrial isoform X2 [Diorhabda carinulata]